MVIMNKFKKGQLNMLTGLINSMEGLNRLFVSLATLKQLKMELKFDE